MSLIAAYLAEIDKVFLICATASIGYLAGSISFACMVTRFATGKDLRMMGSGNIGVMNTALSVSRWAGALVFVAEAAKGAAAVFIPIALGADELIIAVAVISVVVGTRWSCWHSFAGSRGTTAGMAAITAISWQAGFAILITWLLLRLAFSTSFMSTRFTLYLLPIIIASVIGSDIFALYGLALSTIYLSTHSEKTDDHLILKRDWPNVAAFLFSMPSHQ